MEPTRVLLVKHGDSHHRHEGVNGGPDGCRGLTDLGRWEAGRLRDRLMSPGSLTGTVTVYSSVIPRAVETAEILAEAVGGAHGLEQPPEVVRDCGLCTYHTDEKLDGVPWDEIRRDHAAPNGGVFLPFQRGIESWSDLVNRVCKALTAIAVRHAGETVIIAGHEETVEASLIAFGALPVYRTFDVGVHTASVTEWVTADDPSAEWDTAATSWLPARWTLTRFADSAHTEE
ncbi:histidine phosphatase family protein [Streptomyces boncukensis]|uniref:Histidine phosphatase family protein n=1 Tax=Streptomyces boncukensis TaxID=2711219 RepID=A0A6G4WZI3_9ACTN|nr:histidine phosphatase family protein [Streptomyces boncukensis]NGO70017.1 histidine phosphatase family protein [Streptomyces boncukensis]